MKIQASGGDGASAPTRVEQCGRCQGRGQLGAKSFPITCPNCNGDGAVVAYG